MTAAAATMSWAELQGELARWNVGDATALDSANREAVLIVSDSGTHVSVAARTHQFLLAIRDHESPTGVANAIGGGASNDVVFEQATYVIGALRRVREKPRRDRMFLFRLPLLRRDRIVKLVQFLTWAFRPLVAVTSIALAGALVALFAPSYADISFTSGDAVPAYLLLLLSTFGHELGHASAATRFGAPPREIGFTTYVIYPAFYSDVTDAWRLSRWQRVVVDIGGVYLQLWMVGAFSALYAATGWGPLGMAVWFGLGSIAFQLNPIFKFDGYWVVADALGITNLYDQPRRLVRHAWARLRGTKVPSWPWPRVVTVVLVPYSVMSFSFLTVYFVTLGPSIARVIAEYPALLQRLGLGLIGDGPGIDRQLCTTILSSTFFLLAASMLAWRALHSIATILGFRGAQRTVAS